MQRPARGYRWEPFEDGNTAAVTHGGLSPRLIEPRAADIADALVALASEPTSPVGYLADVSYGPAVRAWARCEASIERLDAFLGARGLLDDEGIPRPATRLLDRLETRSESLRARLGLDPLSRARLGRDIVAGSVDVARLMASLGDDDAE